MRFIFFYPPGDEEALETDKTSSPFAPPLGLLYLAGMLEKQGHNVKVVDARVEKITEEKLKTLVASADAVGVSIPTFSLKNAYRIIEMVREIDKDIFIIGGGPHCFLFPKETLSSLKMDAVVQGEGEKAMQSLPNALKNHDLSMVPGIYYMDKDEIKKGKPLEVYENLDIIPFPSHHLTKKYDYGYISGFKPLKARFTAMITSRGCPYRCKFCSRDLFIGRRYRQRSAKNVIEEIETIVGQGYNGIIFVDDNFLLNKKRTMEIMEGIIKEKLDLTMIVEGARVDNADPELYQKMYAAGVKLISYGIESGTQDVLDFYNKRITLDQARYAVHLAHKTGFFTVATFILGAPFETKQHFKKTIEFASSIPLDFVEFYILEYRVGSQLWKEAASKGIIQKKEFFVKACRENNLGAFTLPELENWRKKAYIKFYLRPSYLLKEVMGLLKKGNIDLLKAGIPLMTKLK
ncbi:MAG TPA: radical SAM protein [Thermoplasmatales archaeon]|nr:radical SAM protein [Thermoplasmatales archaeon]